jgi:hypothetical protein
MVSVSTKFATLPSSSMPRELKRVPALLDDSREITVRVEGRCDGPTFRNGAEDAGMVKDLTKPRITDVKIRD